MHVRVYKKKDKKTIRQKRQRKKTKTIRGRCKIKKNK